MADSPLIPIRVENMMNIYVQNTSSGNNAPQTSADNSLQNTIDYTEHIRLGVSENGEPI